MKPGRPKSLPWIQPERNSPLSMQAQIAHWLEALIVKGRLAAGEQLPPETELVEKLGVSRVTLRGAIDELVARGLVSRSHGRGSFVAPARVQYDLRSEHGFFDLLFARASKPEARLLAFGPSAVPVKVAALFGLAAGEKAVGIDRLYLSAGRPVAFAAGWLTPDAAILSREDVEVRSTEALHGEILHHPIAATTTSISAELAGSTVAKRLGVRLRSAVLVLVRSRYDAQNRLREYNRFSIDPSCYELTLSTDNSPSMRAALNVVVARA
jgi:DNA-binding GntR family transcriptional regulator